jgi:glycyl-tRNA synthetase
MKAKKKIKALEAAAEASGAAALKDAAEKARDAEESELNAMFEAALENQETSSALLAALNCPECGTQASFTEARKFNLMFKTFVGPVESDKNAVFLRPETAQGIFVNFPNVSSVTRHKLPFGVAQIGKSFRNEINTKYFLFRTREFEQMEMQYFVRPEEDGKWYEYWKEARMNWYLELGISKDKLRFHDHPEDKLAHYAKQAADVEYLFPFGWGEVEGIHNRTNFDISRHQEYSGKSFQYVDAESKEKFLPYIIETAAGATRAFMAFLVDGYYEEEVKGETRTALRLHPRLAPYKAAIFPLVNKEGMPDKARALEADLRKHFKVFFDDKGAVGRRYRRMDEIGTPYCLTIDTQTLEDDTITVRERDSMEQTRVATSRAREYLFDQLTK